MRIQEFKKQLVEELQSALDGGGEHGSLTIREWYEDAHVISSIADGLGSPLTIDWIGNEEYFVQVTYYIPQLQRSVILDWDGYHGCDTVEDLADVICQWEEEGRMVVKSIRVDKNYNRTI